MTRTERDPKLSNYMLHRGAIGMLIPSMDKQECKVSGEWISLYEEPCSLKAGKDTPPASPVPDPLQGRTM